MRIRSARLLGLALAIGLVAPLFAQRQPGRGFGRMDASMLLTQKSVQEELKMNEDQIAKVEKVNKELREKYGEQLKDAFKDREKMQELTKKMSEERTKALADVLKPDQTKRVKQIEIQLGGLNILTTDAVAKDLKLSEKQIADAKSRAEDLQKDSAEIRKDAGKDKDKQAEAREKIRVLGKEAATKFISTLSDDQKKTFKELTGDEFKGKIVFGPPGR